MNMKTMLCAPLALSGLMMSAPLLAEQGIDEETAFRCLALHAVITESSEDISGANSASLAVQWGEFIMGHFDVAATFEDKLDQAIGNLVKRVNDAEASSSETMLALVRSEIALCTEAEASSAFKGS